jgi:FAD/FMN-containing dehydrogenase
MAIDVNERPAELAQLARSIDGRLVLPDDADYDSLRACFNGAIDRRPTAIVRVTSEQDAAAAIVFARRHDLPIAVRSGGHSAPGHGVCDDGIVIDVRELKRVEVDPVGRIVRCGAGLDWGELDSATQEHGLAVTGGRISTTGVSGLAIGSGSGWLERVWGLTSDKLIGLRMVTADGRIVEASENENADLLWAMRGAGGNFGVITELTFALYPIGPSVLAGARFYAMDRAAEVIRAYREVMRTAPAELCGGLAIQCAPPEPFIPEGMRGKPIVGVLVLWAGSLAEARNGVAPLDALGEPVADMVGEMTYVDLQKMTDPAYPYGMRDYFKGGFIDDLSDEAIDAMIRFGSDLRAPLCNFILLPLGSQTYYARVTDKESPLGTRDANWTFQVLSLWSDPADDPMHRDWTREVAKVMSSYSSMISFPNFVAIDDAARAGDSFSPAVMRRLRDVKRAWDPDNVFRRNVVSLA